MAFVEKLAEGVEVGSYRIHEDRTRYRSYHWSHWPDDYFIKGDPHELPRKIVEQLAIDFPGVRRVAFNESRFRDGALSPVELDYLDKPIEGELTFGGDHGLLELDGHYFSFGSSRNLRQSDYSAAHQDEFNFHIEDKGSLRVVRNKLEHASSPRNGSLRVTTWGYSSKNSHGGSMVGFIDNSGDNLGELVAASLAVVRQVAKERNYPLWKREPSSN